MGGPISICCCTPPNLTPRLGMVQLQHYGWNQLNYSEFDITYADVEPALIANCFDHGITLIESVDTAGELIRRYLGHRSVITQTTEYGDLRWNSYEIERDPRVGGFTLYESTDDSFGYIQRWERAWEVPSVHTTAAGDYPLGSGAAKDNATLLSTSIKIRRRTLTVTQNSFLFRVEGVLLGVGDESFVYEEDFHFYAPNNQSDAMGYANELLSFYDLDAGTFYGTALVTRILSTNGWLTTGYTAEGSEGAGYVMTPIPPIESTPGSEYSIYDLVTSGIGTVIDWTYRNPAWLAFSACMIDPVGDTPYAFASKIFYANEDGICIQRLKLKSYDGANHDDLTYQTIINCSEIIPCTTGCEISCDQLDEVCVVYPWTEWDNLALFHTIPACCSAPP